MEKFKNWLIIKESRRRFDQQKILTESFEPQTGIYWWIPMPKDEGKDFTWDIAKYFDREYGESTHDQMWKTELSSFLIQAWKPFRKFTLKDLSEFKTAYSGLPRGRVTIAVKSYLILHGKDSPTDKIKTIISREFGLHSGITKLQFDMHETMLPHDVSIVQSVLGIVLGVK
jgi:hypothetical protein